MATPASKSDMQINNTAMRPLAPSALIRRDEGRVWLSRDEQDVLQLQVTDGVRLAVLESFVFERHADRAFQRFAARQVTAAAKALRNVPGIADSSMSVSCRIERGAFSVMVADRRRLALAELSRETSGVLEAICTSEPRSTAEVSTSRAVFDRLVGELVRSSALVPPPGSVDFGDFKRTWPFSPRFGVDRGAPVDRYYLNKFIEAIHPTVRGRCLEIGGSVRNNHFYGFAVDEFRTLDLPDSKADDLVGDAAHRHTFDANSWDSIVAFHVLEHCPDPFAVANNLHHWLRTGGHAFVVVPCAQRVHNFPGDYWRFMPDGLRVLFKAFSEVRVSVYGNPLTLASNYLGLSHTELTTDDLEFVHPDYPVISCVIARK